MKILNVLMLAVLAIGSTAHATNKDNMYNDLTMSHYGESFVLSVKKDVLFEREAPNQAPSKTFGQWPRTGCRIHISSDFKSVLLHGGKQYLGKIPSDQYERAFKIDMSGHQATLTCVGNPSVKAVKALLEEGGFEVSLPSEDLDKANSIEEIKFRSQPVSNVRQSTVS